MALPVFTGAASRFSINGLVIGTGTDVAGGESYQYEEIDVLGVLEVAEHALVGYRATMSARIFRVVGRSLKALGVFPTLNAALRSGEMSAGIEDTTTGEVPMQFMGVKIADKNFNDASRGVVVDDCSFVAIKLEDEFERPAAGL